MKLLFTGGHLTPAIALIQHAKKKGDQILYVGRVFSNKSDKISSHEESEIKKIGIEYLTIDAVKIHRHKIIKSLFGLPKMVKSLWEASRIINQFNPDVLVSFGGYLALPLVFVAYVKKIPIITHEQTTTIGLANRIIEKIADVVAYSWPKTKPTSKKFIHTGNPIREEFLNDVEKPDWHKNKLPMIYVTGGSQGSRAINDILKKTLPSLLKKYHIVHQCGGNKSRHYIEEFNHLKNEMSEDLQRNYIVKPWFSAREVAWIFENAKSLVGRSGANTITESIYKATPAIFIPLPYSANQEQFHNAKMVKDGGGAIILNQENFNMKTLDAAIKNMIENHKFYKKNMQKLSLNLINNPEKNIYKAIKILAK